MFNFNKLRGRIRELYGSQDNFAKALKISARSLSLKLNNYVSFTSEEIYKSLKLLNISDEEVMEYFFNKKVQKFEQEQEVV